jgi:hypothetical protein
VTPAASTRRCATHRQLYNIALTYAAKQDADHAVRVVCQGKGDEENGEAENGDGYADVIIGTPDNHGRRREVTVHCREDFRLRGDGGNRLTPRFAERRPRFTAS